MEPKSKYEPSKAARIIIEIILIGIVASVGIAIIMVIFIGLAAWYNTLF